MRSGKHIVWLTPGFASSEKDDLAMPTLQNLAKEYRCSYPDIELTIVSLHWPLTASTYSWNGITVHCLGGANIRYPLRFLLWRKAQHKLRAIHRQKKIDLIHSFWYNESAFLADRFANMNKIPHICSVMGQDVLPGNRYARLLKKKNIFTVGISERSSETLRASCGKEVDIIIPIGIEPIVNRSVHEKNIDIIGVGSQTQVKRYDKFLDVISIVRKSFPKVTVQLVGDGPESDRLKTKAQAAGLLSNVTFAGRLNRDEVLVQMQKSRILLHTSAIEGMGYIFPEAAACSCYIVSTPVGIIKEDEFTFVGEDNYVLAEQVCKLLETSDVAPARTRFTIAETANSYWNIYEKMIE